MKFLVLADLHSRRSMLERILDEAGPVDVVLLGGDITNFGGPQDAERLVRLAQQASPRVYAVAGNCDSAAIEARLVELGVSLHARGVVLDGVGLHGLSGMPPWKTGMYQFTEPQMADALQAGSAQLAPARLHVTLSHSPPRDSRCDQIHDGTHVGSSALRAFVERGRPRLVLCGHIHEARGMDHIGPTTVLNCGAAVDGCYALVEIGPEISWELCQAAIPAGSVPRS